MSSSDAVGCPANEISDFERLFRRQHAGRYDMGMKTMLRDWLGVAKLETALDSAEKRMIDQRAMRKEIADALVAVFSGECNIQHSSQWFEYLEDHGATFERTMRKITGKQAKDVARSVVEARIGGEDFIDELVARVRRKQLDA